MHHNSNLYHFINLLKQCAWDCNFSPHKVCSILITLYIVYGTFVGLVHNAQSHFEPPTLVVCLCNWSDEVEVNIGMHDVCKL